MGGHKRGRRNEFRRRVFFDPSCIVVSDIALMPRVLSPRLRGAAKRRSNGQQGCPISLTMTEMRRRHKPSRRAARAFFCMCGVGARWPCQAGRHGQEASRRRCSVEDVQMNFASDNGAGVAPADSRGDRRLESGVTRRPMARTHLPRARKRFCPRFSKQQVTAFLVRDGTAANALALSALVRPWEAIFCHEEAHVHDDECGAPEFFAGGAKLVGIPGLAGKITPEGCRRDARALSARPRQVVAARRALALASHRGGHALYRSAEIAALGVARARGRNWRSIWTARASPMRSSALGATPAEMTWRAGVDALSFGATKNGALACEAVVFFDPDRGAAFRLSAQARRSHACPRGASSARRWRPISRMACGSQRAQRQSRRGAAGRRPAQRAGRAPRPGRPRPTRSSSSRRPHAPSAGSAPARGSTIGRPGRWRASLRLATERPFTASSLRSKLPRPKSSRWRNSRRVNYIYAVCAP